MIFISKIHLKQNFHGTAVVKGQKVEAELTVFTIKDGKMFKGIKSSILKCVEIFNTFDQDAMPSADFMAHMLRGFFMEFSKAPWK